MARYLVTGGAGYVGSHVVLALHRRGDDVVVLDDLSQGHRAALPAGVPLVRRNLADRSALSEVFAGPAFDGVLHFAALSLVGESMRQPLRYLAENLANTACLADAAVKAGCMRFVLSSTAALFGQGSTEPLDESAPYAPASAYGESKGMAERALDWAGRVHGLRSACLRYFNAAGADASGTIGEDHDPETHLVPLAIRAALGHGPGLTVFGEDYATLDGTPIRDYVHVTDLADAHLRVLDHLEQVSSCRFNVGGGRGHSVRDVIRVVEQVTGRPVPHTVGARREGDPPVLVASSAALGRATGWAPRHSDLETIVRTACLWHSAHPHGYGDREPNARPGRGEAPARGSVADAVPARA